MDASLRCPECAYDWSGTAGEQVKCPECGGTFERSKVAAQHALMVGVALTWIAYGAAAVLVGDAVGASYAHLPRAGEGVSGSAFWGTRLLAAPGAIVFAVGVALLASRVERAGFARRWPVAVALVLGGSTMYFLDSSRSVGVASPDFPGWLVRNAWRDAAEWARGLSLPLVALAGARGVREVGRRVSLPLTRGTWWIGALAVCGVVAYGVARWQGMFATNAAAAAAAAGFPPGFAQSLPPGAARPPGMPPPPAFYTTDTLNQLLTSIAGFLSRAALVGLGMATLVLRRAWNVR